MKRPRTKHRPEQSPIAQRAAENRAIAARVVAAREHYGVSDLRRWQVILRIAAEIKPGDMKL